ncbi:MAG: hypothetical protein ACOYVK_19655 [Bacillota bacterium]
MIELNSILTQEEIDFLLAGGKLNLSDTKIAQSDPMPKAADKKEDE